MLLLTGALKAQGVYNNGANIVVSSGTYFVIDGNTGNFRNETSGNDGVIDLTGTLKLGGNFTNNVAASDAFGTLASGSEVIFAGTGTQTIGGSSSAVYNFDKLTVNSGATVEVTELKKITTAGTTTVNGTLTLLDDGAGVATFLNNGSIAGSGTYNVQRNLAGAGVGTPNGRRWYIGSPVDGATSSSVDAASTDKFQQWNETTFNYTEINDNVTSLPVTRGYIFRGGATKDVTFSGTAFNTGAISASGLTYTGTTNANRGFHILSNPYPSYFDWESATRTNVSTTYTIKTATAGGTVVNDTYNGSSHVGTNNNAAGALTQYIAPAQGFWVEASVTGAQVDFANAGRSHQTGSLKSIDNSLVRLNLSNGFTSDQTVINFNEGSTANFDDYDSKKVFIGTNSEVYSPVEDKKLVINTLPILSEETVVPLTLTILADGKYSFEAEEITGNVNNFKVYIEDKLTNTLHNLSDTPKYSFNATTGESTGRFALVFGEKSAAGLSSTTIQKISLFNVNREVNINMNGLENGEANVYDVIGKKVATVKLNESTNQFEINGSAGVYTVVVKAGNFNKTQKIIIQ